MHKTATKLMLVGDLHISDVAPASRNDDYANHIFEKLQFIFSASLERGVDAVVFSGDIFHRRSFSNISVLISIIKWFKQWSMKFRILTIAGNHDMSLKDQSIDGQPFALLKVSDAVEHIPSSGLVIGDTAIFGRDFTRNMCPGYFAAPDGVEQRWKLVISHANLIPTATEGRGDFLQYGGLDLSNVDVLFNGHIHTDFGLHRYGDAQVVNVGSVSRVSRDDVRREVFVCYAEFGDELVLEKVHVPCRPPEEVFTSKVSIADEEVAVIDVDKIVAQMQIVDMEAPWESVDMSPEIRDTVEQYIDRAKAQNV